MRRTTVLPRLAASTAISISSFWAPSALPGYFLAMKSSVDFGTSARTSAGTSLSLNTTVAVLVSAVCAARVRREGWPGPEPTRRMRPRLEGAERGEMVMSCRAEAAGSASESNDVEAAGVEEGAEEEVASVPGKTWRTRSISGFDERRDAIRSIDQYSLIWAIQRILVAVATFASSAEEHERTRAAVASCEIGDAGSSAESGGVRGGVGGRDRS